MDRHTLTRREEAGWAEFRSALDNLLPGQRETLAVNDDGWTARDLVWHVRYWWEHLTGMLEEMREGTFREPESDDALTDAQNAAVLVRARGKSFAESERGADEARSRMLEAWASLPEVDEAAARWFLWETIEHYEEHLAGLRAAGEVSA